MKTRTILIWENGTYLNENPEQELLDAKSEEYDEVTVPEELIQNLENGLITNDEFFTSAMYYHFNELSHQ